MNISTQHQSLHPVQSVKPSGHHEQTLSETHAVGGPSATAEHAIQQRDQMHLSETRAQTHGVSPLKVLSLHGGVLAAEHGLHFSLHKLSTHQISTTQANTVNALGNVSGAVASGYLTYTAIEHTPFMPWRRVTMMRPLPMGSRQHWMQGWLWPIPWLFLNGRPR